VRDNDESVKVIYDDLKAETPKALLLSVDDEEVWIPKSQIEYEDREKRELWIPRWLAAKKELDAI